MTFVPDHELKQSNGFTLAPMIDFLFLMLAVFASLAVTRIATRDTEIDLVKSKRSGSTTSSPADLKIINITIAENGSYKWITDIRDHPLNSAQEIADELAREYQKGLLPHDKLLTQVLLRIDRNARWQPILDALLAIREEGFEVRPVYEPD